jgi:hypothetical protein
MKTMKNDGFPFPSASGTTTALELARKLGWTGTLIAGGTKAGMVFVFETGNRYSI